MIVPFSANMSVNACATGFTPRPNCHPSRPPHLDAARLHLGPLVDAVQQLEQIAVLFFLRDLQQVEAFSHDSLSPSEFGWYAAPCGESGCRETAAAGTQIIAEAVLAIALPPGTEEPAPRHPPRGKMSAIVLFNKPFGVLSQFSPSAGRPTLRDFLPARDIYPAGRLDADSEGLLVLTADGGLQHRISDPRHKLPKVYWAEVEGVPDDTALVRLGQGRETSRLHDATRAGSPLIRAFLALAPRASCAIPPSYSHQLARDRSRGRTQSTSAPHDCGSRAIPPCGSYVTPWASGRSEDSYPGQWRALEVTGLLRGGERARAWSTNQFVRR